MAGRLRFRTRMAAEIDEALRRRGFDPVNTPKLLASIKDKGWKGQPLLYPGETIYTLRRGGVVFSTFVKTNADRESVTVLASNPGEDRRLSRQEQYLKVTCSEKSGPPEKVAEDIARKVAELAAFKTAPRMQVHDHAGQLIDGTPAPDDGVSDLASTARQLILENVDYFAYTPHNKFAMANYGKMAWFLNKFGITPLIASEITMPLQPGHPNGPHHIVIAADQAAASRVMNSILKYRDKSLAMPSYFLGMTMDQIYRELEPLRKSGDVVVILAHPVNFNDTHLPISGVGLFSAVQLGHLSFDAAMAFASQTDAAECWNASLYMGEMKFSSREFEATMRALVAKHAAKLGLPPGLRLSTNLSNLAVAAELEERFGLGQTYGSDAHTEAPLNLGYNVGGGWFSGGWTTLTMPPGPAPDAAALVRGISRKEIKLGAVLFTEIEDGLIKIASDRTERPKEAAKAIAHQSRQVLATYAGELARDFAHFLAHGEFGNIKRMSE